jgi:hypothetical protein
MTASLGRTALAFALLLACGACFPTFQSARVEPGFRVDAAVTALADQRRDNKPQGPDDIVALIPAYGFGRRFELGLPIAVYADDGFRTGPPNYGKIVWLLMPYAKLALLGADSKDHLSVSAQTAYLSPASVRPALIPSMLRLDSTITPLEALRPGRAHVSVIARSSWASPPCDGR